MKRQRTKSRTARSRISKKDFHGMWKLEAFEEPSANGKMVRSDRIGILVYDRKGRMSVQVMNRQPAAPADGAPASLSASGYVAYFGKYTIDAKKNQVTHHLEGSDHKELMGTDVIRMFRLSGRRLTLSSAREDEHWRLIWRRI